jgi:hypothetical protein
MFLCLINLSNSSFALIFHVPFLSFAGDQISENEICEACGGNGVSGEG